MKSMNFRGSVFVAVLAFSGLALAADAAKDMAMPMAHKEMTTEQRQKMAALHEKMAACLKSDSKIETCHMEMKKSCMENMGEHQCQMMGGMHGMMGKMKHDSMPEPKTESK